MNAPIKYFTDLFAWQKSHTLAIKIYTVTKHFPREELFTLTDQLRRASISVSSNIAEGFTRRSRKEKNRFYTIALGSLMEIHSQILIARDIGYLTDSEYNGLHFFIKEIRQLTAGLIRSSESKPSSPEY